MKQKTLGLIFAVVIMGIALSISVYVLYYIFVGDVANFNMLLMWLGGSVMIVSLFLFRFLVDYCTEKDKI